MGRCISHRVETKARDYIRTVIDKYGSDGDAISDALFRDITERDYGIDAIVELFFEGKPTGELALLQIKGTQNTIIPLKTTPCVSCSISASNAAYALQQNIPVLLVYICVNKPEVFYFARIQDVLTEEQKQMINNQDSLSVRIPVFNCSEQDIRPMFDLIHEYYL